jgi:hypothetical protein
MPPPHQVQRLPAAGGVPARTAAGVIEGGRLDHPPAVASVALLAPPARPGAGAAGWEWEGGRHGSGEWRAYAPDAAAALEAAWQRCAGGDRHGLCHHSFPCLCSCVLSLLWGLSVQNQQHGMKLPFRPWLGGDQAGRSVDVSPDHFVDVGRPELRQARSAMRGEVIFRTPVRFVVKIPMENTKAHGNKFAAHGYRLAGTAPASAASAVSRRPPAVSVPRRRRRRPWRRGLRPSTLASRRQRPRGRPRGPRRATPARGCSWTRGSCGRPSPRR